MPSGSLASRDLRPSSGCTSHNVGASIAVVAVAVVAVGTSVVAVEGGDGEVVAEGVDVVDENGEWTVVDDNEKTGTASADKCGLVETESTVVGAGVVDSDAAAAAVAVGGGVGEASGECLTVVSDGTRTLVVVVVVVEERNEGLVLVVVERRPAFFEGRQREE